MFSSLLININGSIRFGKRDFSRKEGIVYIQNLGIKRIKTITKSLYEV